MCVFFLYTVDFTLPSSFLVNLVQALVSVRLLSVHGGLHTSIFLSGELSSGTGQCASSFCARWTSHFHLPFW